MSYCFYFIYYLLVNAICELQFKFLLNFIFIVFNGVTDFCSVHAAIVVKICYVTL